MSIFSLQEIFGAGQRRRELKLNKGMVWLWRLLSLLGLDPPFEFIVIKAQGLCYFADGMLFCKADRAGP
jgi:hypothetical protein